MFAFQIERRMNNPNPIANTRTMSSFPLGKCPGFRTNNIPIAIIAIEQMNAAQHGTLYDKGSGKRPLSLSEWKAK
jgi:hypothetical protein